MKTMYTLSKDINKDIQNLYKTSDLEDALKQITELFNQKKDEILVAWAAEHGFEPNKAILIEERTETGYKVYVREMTDVEKSLSNNGRRLNND